MRGQWALEMTDFHHLTILIPIIINTRQMAGKLLARLTVGIPIIQEDQGELLKLMSSSLRGAPVQS